MGTCIMSMVLSFLMLVRFCRVLPFSFFLSFSRTRRSRVGLYIHSHDLHSFLDVCLSGVCLTRRSVWSGLRNLMAPCWRASCSRTVRQRQRPPCGLLCKTRRTDRAGSSEALQAKSLSFCFETTRDEDVFLSTTTPCVWRAPGCPIIYSRCDRCEMD